jgi:hypothetical protein
MVAQQGSKAQARWYLSRKMRENTKIKNQKSKVRQFCAQQEMIDFL